MLHKYLLNERLKDRDQNRAQGKEQEERRETKQGGAEGGDRGMREAELGRDEKEGWVECLGEGTSLLISG